MRFTIVPLFAALAGLSYAAPTSDLEARQGGGFYAAGNQYSGPGCTNLIYGDPIYVSNACTALNRFDTPGITINSYSLAQVNAGCSVKLYTTSTCTGTAYSALVGKCVQGNAPFVSAIVTCA